MILIRKSPAPPELEALKKEAEEKMLSDKDGYDLLRNPLKAKVRDALMCEQGHLCAYCMRRLPDERILSEDADLSDIYIEHWQARSAGNTTGENMGLSYGNMLAVCSGNEKATDAKGRHKRRFLTCDKKRRNKPLTVNPLDKDTLDTVYYLSDGTMKSTNRDIENDINIRLNLNCHEDGVTLPLNRRNVLDAVQNDLLQQQGDPLQNCIEQLHIWESESDPKTPYIGIAIWWLREQIRVLSEE